MLLRVPKIHDIGATDNMFGLTIFAGLLAAGIVFATLRSRGNEKPTVTRLVSRGR
jgi:hypothetical protein